MKTEIKAATKIQTAKAIEAATLETKASEQISKTLISLYKSILSAGNADQFELLNKRLTLAINTAQGWKYPSLNGIYRQGFKVSTAPNILSTFRMFCKLELTQEKRDEVIKSGIAAMRSEIKKAKETAEAANDSDTEADADASMSAAAEVVEELAAMEAEQISPAHQQCISLLMQLDASQVSAVTRYLGSLLQSEVA